MTATHLAVKDALATALTDRWVSFACTLDEVEAAARELGWTAVPTRPGDADRTTLRPTSSGMAHPRSLSAVYGLGEQPLHTDGAHHLQPPDIVVLQSPAGSLTGTALWAPLEVTEAISVDAWTNGLFIVSSGGRTCLAPALCAGQLRFDPGCMTPADNLARQVVTEAKAARATCHSFAWDAPGTTLFINNRHTLHARNAVTAREDRRIVRIAYRAVGATT